MATREMQEQSDVLDQRPDRSFMGARTIVSCAPMSLPIHKESRGPAPMQPALCLVYRSQTSEPTSAQSCLAHSPFLVAALVLDMESRMLLKVVLLQVEQQ